MTLEQLLEDGELNGYTAGYEGYAGLKALGIASDVDECRNSTCYKCGTKDLDYRPFHRPGSYRAFAVCPKCKEAVEF